MGKSPGKWIKTLLLGKKSSKSNNISKGRQKTASKGETPVSSKFSEPGITADTTLISSPMVATDAKDKVGFENRVAGRLPNDELVVSTGKDDGSTQAIITSASSEDPEKFQLEEAAITVQTAFRGYTARREFQTLKGIIRLQSLVRGKLVRRQAVSTLRSVEGIVKFQALVRGNKGVKVSTQVDTLTKNAFVRKLLASLPSSIPLRLQYGPGDSNSAAQWLERWTMSRFWEPLSQHKENLDTKSCRKNGTLQMVETKQGSSKRSVRKLSGANASGGNAGNVSACSLTGSEKRKGNLRKISSQVEASGQEHPQNDLEKVQTSLRKASGQPKEVSVQSESEDRKSKYTMRKTSRSATPVALSEQIPSGSVKKPNNVPVAPVKQSDLEKSMDIPPEEQVEKLSINPSVNTSHMESDTKNEDSQRMNLELNLRDNGTTNQQTSHRRASLPAKFDHQESAVHNTHKLPSYMAPTESVKAKLRGQGSPRFAKDVDEKNGTTRRHSLTSSTNSLLNSLSPRAQRLVQANGKGLIRCDRSLISSRDSCDKVVQPEWRR